MYTAPVDTWDFHKNICEKCFHDCLFDKERIMELHLYENAHYFIEELSRICDLYIITSRPLEVRNHTVAWLANEGIYKHIQEVIFDNNKTEVCDTYQLNFHIEDAPKHINGITNNVDDHPGLVYDTQVIVYDQPYNQSVNRSVRVKNWSEIYEFLTAAATIARYATA
jgi:5'(3')-deoxyribonucleotidase